MSKERYGVTFQVFDLETGKHVVAGNTRFEVPLQDLVLAFTVLSHAISEHTKKALVKVVKDRSDCEASAEQVERPQGESGASPTGSEG